MIERIKSEDGGSVWVVSPIERSDNPDGSVWAVCGVGVPEELVRGSQGEG